VGSTQSRNSRNDPGSGHICRSGRSNSTLHRGGAAAEQPCGVEVVGHQAVLDAFSIRSRTAAVCSAPPRIGPVRAGHWPGGGWNDGAGMDKRLRFPPFARREQNQLRESQSRWSKPAELARCDSDQFVAQGPQWRMTSSTPVGGGAQRMIATRSGPAAGMVTIQDRAQGHVLSWLPGTGSAPAIGCERADAPGDRNSWRWVVFEGCNADHHQSDQAVSSTQGEHGVLNVPGWRADAIEWRRKCVSVRAGPHGVAHGGARTSGRFLRFALEHGWSDWPRRTLESLGRGRTGRAGFGQCSMNRLAMPFCEDVSDHLGFRSGREPPDRSAKNWVARFLVASPCRG